MRFNASPKHLIGQHAFLSASKNAWLNYDDDKLDRVFLAQQAANHGTELHDLAARCIKLKQKLPDTPTTMNLYVNDCIGFGMSPEQVLFYSANCFGTTDAIGLRKDPQSGRFVLRIFDLKTGVLKVVTPTQLKIYAALFCLEYGFSPHEIDIELRIYQNDDCAIYEADPDEIRKIMDRIIVADRRVNQIREENE